MLNTPPKGSWEDLFDRANEAVAIGRSDGVEQMEAVLARLDKLTPGQRAAGAGHLEELRRGAVAVLLQGYMARDRYDDALALVASHADVLDDEYASDLPLVFAQLHYHAGRVDEAARHLQAYLDAFPGDLDALTAYVMQATLYGLSERALAAVNDAAAEVANRRAGKRSKEERGLLHRLRALVYMRMRDHDTALAEFEAACRLFPPLRDTMHPLYQQLMVEGEYERALRLMESYRGESPGVRFWQGVAWRHLGDEARARTHWLRVSTPDIDDVTFKDLPFWILSHYYLGDPVGAGLSAALEMLLDADEDIERWLIYTLAGLGSALRGDALAANANFETARNLYAAVPGRGKRIPKDFAFLLADLVSAEERAPYLAYFEPPDGASPS